MPFAVAMGMSNSRYSKLAMVMALVINESAAFMEKDNRSERWNRIHRSDLAGGGHAARDGVQDNPPGDRKTRATHVFDALVERSVGRYILATSSLAGECVRAYVPGPFRLMTSLLCTRVRDALFSGEHDVLGPDDGQSSRLSYKRFLSPEMNTDDYLDRVPENFESAIQYKYSRVSAAFLVRHGIGHAVADDDTGRCSTDQDRARANGRSKLAVLDERIQDAPSNGIEEKAASYSILNSLNSFRKMRRTVIEDDLDLLSEDLEDEDHLKKPPRVVGSRVKERGGNGGVKEIAAGVSQRPPDDVRVRREGLGTLNLISNGDEGAIKLVNKLRGAHAGPDKRADKVRYRDSTRREKSS